MSGEVEEMFEEAGTELEWEPWSPDSGGQTAEPLTMEALEQAFDEMEEMLERAHHRDVEPPGVFIGHTCGHLCKYVPRLGVSGEDVAQWFSEARNSPCPLCQDGDDEPEIDVEVYVRR